MIWLSKEEFRWFSVNHVRQMLSRELNQGTTAVAACYPPSYAATLGFEPEHHDRLRSVIHLAMRSHFFLRCCSSAWILKIVVFVAVLTPLQACKEGQPQVQEFHLLAET